MSFRRNLNKELSGKSKGNDILNCDLEIFSLKNLMFQIKF